MAEFDIIENNWYIALASDELYKTPVSVEMEGESIVFFRNEDSKVSALENRCAHRGLKLSYGTVQSNLLKCSYHGWQYNSKGELEKIPARACQGKCKKVKLVKSYPVVESQQQIWVWIGDSIPDELPYKFFGVEDDGWSSFYMKNDFEANVVDCLENFLDVPHTKIVHSKLFREENWNDIQIEVETFGNRVAAQFVDEKPLKGFGPSICFPKNVAMIHTDQFIMPSVSRVDYLFEDYGFVITSQCTQLNNKKTRVTTAISWKLKVPVFISRIFLKYYCRKVIKQDVELLNRLGYDRPNGHQDVFDEADVMAKEIRYLRKSKSEITKKVAQKKISMRI